jgi:hypothetical protein
MFKKHPTLGKKTLAKMYFLMNAKQDNVILDKLDNNSTDIGDVHQQKNKQVFSKDVP